MAGDFSADSGVTMTGTSAQAASPRLVAVVAVARNGVIGAENRMPWRISSDLKRFKALTWGKPMIMGRRNWDSIGRPLPGRETIVLTRNPHFSAEGAHVAFSPDEALATARRLAAHVSATEIVIAGGAEIYRAYLDQTEIIHLTEVSMHAQGDVFFPRLDPAEWREAARENPSRGAKDEADFAYVTLERRRG
jgi:dihydrofolate reductase